MVATALQASRCGAAQTFLDALVSRNDPLPAVSRLAMVFAHPDDETIAIGAQLHRLGDAALIVVTDGAPRDLVDARRHGFADATSYARARRLELNNALHTAGCGRMRVIALDIPDQKAAFAMAEVAHWLTRIFIERATEVVLTHAYEGGHPDHDACAFAVHAAAELLAREGHAPEIVEAPFYHAEGGRMVTQHFGDIRMPEYAIVLDAAERDRKARMFEAHATQRDMLVHFDRNAERFRPASAVDFGRLPNGGELFYEQQRWMTGSQWLALAADARDALGLRGVPCL